MNVYHVVREQHAEVSRIIRKMPVDEKAYYQIRESRPRSGVRRAAKFLYLNRTAFGGIYRLNRRGEFNVPYGGGSRTPAILWEKSLLEQASLALENCKLVASDFEPILGDARSGDVIYCDPTYTVAHNSNGFIRYNERNFSWSDQERLGRALECAVARGCTVLLSNAHAPAVRRLFNPDRVFVLKRISAVSPNPEMRQEVLEYLFLWTGTKGAAVDGFDTVGQ